MYRTILLEAVKLTYQLIQVGIIIYNTIAGTEIDIIPGLIVDGSK
jgi:hypothetical protein